MKSPEQLVELFKKSISDNWVLDKQFSNTDGTRLTLWHFKLWDFSVDQDSVITLCYDHDERSFYVLEVSDDDRVEFKTAYESLLKLAPEYQLLDTDGWL